MTLLQIVGDACDEMGLDHPQGIIGNQQPQVRQLFALLRRLCVDLCKQYDWQELVSTAVIQTESVVLRATIQQGSNVIELEDANSITTDYSVQGEGIQQGSNVISVSGATITLSRPATKTGTFDMTFGKYRYDLPDDYLRMIDNTAWNSNSMHRMYGAVSPQGWQSLKSSVVNLGINLRYRIRKGKIEISPTPNKSTSITYEYISNGFVVQNETRSDYFVDDQDETIFDHSLLVIGLMLSFRQANGLDAMFELATFQSMLSTLKDQDSPAPAIHVSRNRAPHLLNQRNIPDGNWNV